MKDFETWLSEVKLWKMSTANVNWLKDCHAAILTLRLPESSEIRRHIIETLKPEEMAGDDGWNAVIKLIEEHYKMDDVAGSFSVWRDFRKLERQPEQTIDQYILSYDRFMNLMKRHKMDLPPMIHGLNLIYSSKLSDNDLKIVMREVDNDKPEDMYKDAKKSLKKYLGTSSVSSKVSDNNGANGNPAVSVVSPITNSEVKQEILFSS